jgi:general secretion pathway protein C
MTISFSIPTVNEVTLRRMLRREALMPAVKLARILLIIISFLFLILIVSELIKATLSVKTKVSQLHHNVEAARLAVLAPKTSVDSPSNLKHIAERAVFGQITAAQTTNASEQSKPVSKAPLGLIGTYIRTGEEPYAIIEDQKKKVQDVFGIGDSIFGEAKLVSVASDQVEIERNNEREILTMDETKSPSSDFKGGIAALNDTHYVVEEAEIDQALQNLPVLLTQARAVPYFRDGRATGLRLFAVKSGSLYEKLGLKNGDILKAINGNSLADLSQAMQLFEKLKSERQINVTLERNSEEKDVKYEIK